MMMRNLERRPIKHGHSAFAGDVVAMNRHVNRVVLNQVRIPDL